MDSSTLIPWKTFSATESVGVLTPGWSLDGEAPVEGGARSFEVEVTFASPFLATPVLQVGLSCFDLDQRRSGRLGLRVTELTPRGFKVAIETWADTRVYAASFNWLALGA